MLLICCIWADLHVCEICLCIDIVSSKYRAYIHAKHFHTVFRLDFCWTNHHWYVLLRLNLLINIISVFIIDWVLQIELNCWSSLTQTLYMCSIHCCNCICNTCCFASWTLSWTHHTQYHLHIYGVHSGPV